MWNGDALRYGWCSGITGVLLYKPIRAAWIFQLGINGTSMSPGDNAPLSRRKDVDNPYLLLYLYTKFHEADRLGRKASNWWPNVVGTTDRMLSERLAGFSGIRGRMSSELVAECAGIDTL